MPINADTSLEAEADELGVKAARGEKVTVAGTSANLQESTPTIAPIQGFGLLNKIKNAVKSKVKSGVNKVKAGVNVVKNKVKATVNVVKNKVKATVNAVKNKVKASVNAVKNKVKASVKAVKSTLKAVRNKVKSSIKAVKNKVKSGLNAVKNKVKQGVNKAKSFANKVKNKVKQGVNKAKSFAKKVKGKVKQGLNKAKSFANKVKGKVKQGVNKVKSLTNKVKNKVKQSVNKVKSLTNKVKNKVKQTAQKAKNTYNTVKNKLKSGLTKAKSTYNSLKDKAKNTGNAIKNSLKNTNWKDAGHAALDIAGFIPVIGAVADLGNAAWYAAEGDYANAALSGISAIPGLGDAVGAAAKGGKLIAKVSKGNKLLTGVGKLLPNAGKLLDKGGKIIKGNKLLAGASKLLPNAGKLGDLAKLTKKIPGKLGEVVGKIPLPNKVKSLAKGVVKYGVPAAVHGVNVAGFAGGISAAQEYVKKGDYVNAGLALVSGSAGLGHTVKSANKLRKGKVNGVGNKVKGGGSKNNKLSGVEDNKGGFEQVKDKEKGVKSQNSTQSSVTLTSTKKRPNGSGETTTHPHHPEIEPGVVAKEKTHDGHEIKVLKDGRVVRCSDCGEIRIQYQDILEQRVDLKLRLAAIEGLSNPQQKAEQAQKFAQELASIQKIQQAKAAYVDVGEEYVNALEPVLEERKTDPNKSPFHEWYYGNLRTLGINYDELVKDFVENNTYGMGEAEANAIFGYTSALFYQKLNQLLREGVKPEKTELLSALLNRALKKLPLARKSNEGNLYRGINIPEAQIENFINQHQLGSNVTNKDFLSVASYPVEPFWSNSNVRLTIVPKSIDSKGRDITELAFGTHYIEILTKGNLKNDTDEALFMTGSKFQVIDVQPTAGTRTIKDKKSGAEITENITVYNITVKEK